MNPNELIQKGLGLASGVAGQAQKRLSGPTQGLISRVKAVRGGAGKELSDPAITAKVESTIFRDGQFAKDKISVNTVDGVVYLRGTLKTAAQIKALEAAARAIPEVKDVENLISQPKTRKKPPTGRFKKAGETPVRRGKLTGDRTDDIADGESTPKAKARKAEGRSPAPLGSKDVARTTPDVGGESGSTASTPAEGTTGPDSVGTPDKAGSLPTPTV